MVTLIDIGLALLVFLSLVAGWRNGLVDSLFSFAAYLVGIVVAVQVTPVVAGHLPSWAGRVPGANIVLGVFLFLAAFFVVRLIGSTTSSKRKKDPEFSDSLLGGLLGLARGLFLVAAIACFLVAYLPRQGKVFQESRALPLLTGPGKVVARLAPEGLRSRMTAGWAELEEERMTGKRSDGGPVSI